MSKIARQPARRFSVLRSTPPSVLAAAAIHLPRQHETRPWWLRPACPPPWRRGIPPSFPPIHVTRPRESRSTRRRIHATRPRESLPSIHRPPWQSPMLMLLLPRHGAADDDFSDCRFNSSASARSDSWRFCSSFCSCSRCESVAAASAARCSSLLAAVSVFHPHRLVLASRQRRVAVPPVTVPSTRATATRIATPLSRSIPGMLPDGICFSVRGGTDGVRGSKVSA